MSVVVSVGDTFIEKNNKIINLLYFFFLSLYRFIFYLRPWLRSGVGGGVSD
jgi:hypothetical protein